MDFPPRWQGHLAYIENLPGWHIYAIDHAGHGLSGDRRGTYRLADFADDMAEFIESVAGSSVAYFGASLGALVGMMVAGTRPNLIKTMVLGDAPWSLLTQNYMGSPLQQSRTATKAHLEAGISVEEEKKTIAAADPSLTSAQVESRAISMSQLRPNTCDALIDGSFADGWDVDQTLKDTTTATMILQGDDQNGGFQPDSDVTRMAELYADSEAAKFYGLGHGLDYGVPAAPFDIARGFLQRRHLDWQRC
ncbi:MAG: alpha/beta fold hydrolase [Dehalococcoidia bacterium]|jgi:pimeloyl-ACP methyl ester carboxylesterase|nr:alpha/beta fold hydrolase [Dehalococcoidia bacterium]